MISQFFKLLVFSFLVFSQASWGKNLVSISASSEWEPKSKKYGAERALDGNLGTSWVDGSVTEGIGESLTVRFKQPIQFRSFSIHNGFGDPKLWAVHHRVKKFRISTEEGFEETISLKDFLSKQDIQLNSEFSGKDVSFTILEVYKGNRLNHAAIAELFFHSSQAGSVIVPPKNTWAMGKWKTESNLARIQLHSDGTCEMGYESAKMLCTWREKGNLVHVQLEDKLPLTNTDALILRKTGTSSSPEIEVNGKYRFVVNKDEV